ncbi:polysaccharide pyruvyl transferase CsaB [Pseudoflavonifractor phocaeensis]|uniref:polysaccharide pyruvyl transferase CsaB n=1 Tax=Pseudoflavonifractor phocaeensis TaxID=1870988 RepID=UPI001F1C756E|nr:polysaccharide pyruvyl transferase CsaB [Pseudoflavonifractor phocaeensis]MCF2661386.1 polysaccharide pyruvyl transferase CsaB [Pseudoflavonifractor phocaeensis]
MKILMATMGLDIGGAETHIVELSKELQKRGHQVVVVSNGGVYVPEITAAGIRHYSAPLHRRSLSDMRRSIAVLREVIGTERPDVVHAHARIPAFLCGRLQRSMGFPFVTSCHGVYQVSGVLRLLSNWGDRTLAVSEDIRDYLIHQYQIPPQHITLTINGIDTDKFSPEVSGETVRRELGLGDAPVIGHVSRLDAETALAARQLIENAPALDRAFPGIRILIVGGGAVYEELSTRAREVNQAMGRDCLVLTGPRTDVNLLVAACDLFVGVSRAALEAMSACKPVVLSGAQGHTGLFTPGLLDKAVDTNFCCRTDPTATQEQLLSDLTAALSLPQDTRKELGNYGRSVVQQHYSVHRMTDDCLSVYDQVRRRRHRVVMSGYYGFSNAGDDAILESIQQAIHEASDDVAVTVLSNDPELTHAQYGMDAIPRFRVWKVFSALRRSDALLSGGGSLLQDTTSTRSLLYYLAVIRCAQWLGKPVMLYANGIGPVRRPANRRRVKKVVERATLVTLRDHSSARELADMGVDRPDLYVTADPVFHLSPAPEARGRELLQAAGLAPGMPFVAVSVRDWPDTEHFCRELARLCDHLRRTHGMEVLFLLMQPSRDRTAAQQVRQFMKEPSFLLDEPCTPRELMAVLGQARLCLAMRLHTLIFAARMAVPSMGLVYDPKVDSYLRELDLPAAGYVDSFDGDEAIRRADAMMAEYGDVLARLRQKSAQLTQDARENERLLLEMLEQHKK